jgi:hypothetical protein
MTAGLFRLSVNNPIKLSNSAAGVPKIKVSPPKAESGEPQPGLKTIMTVRAASATKATARPKRPTIAHDRGTAGVSTGGCSFMALFAAILQLYFHRC